MSVLSEVINLTELGQDISGFTIAIMPAVLIISIFTAVGAGLYLFLTNVFGGVGKAMKPRR